MEDDVADVALPSVQGEAEEEGRHDSCIRMDTFVLTIRSALDALASLTVSDTVQDVFVTPPQLDGELVTLTLLPRSRWQTLLNLEVIQQRNKPKEPPKPPEKAPFFLPTLPGVDHRFDVSQAEQEKKTSKPTRRLERAAGASESVFFRKLQEEDQGGDCEFYTLTVD